MENMNTNANVEFTNELLETNKEARQQAFDRLSESDSYTLRKSHIWTKLNPDGFKTVCGVYMTVQQVADFFGVEKETIKIYTKAERNGKPNEHRKELIEAGVKSLSNDECKNLVENFMGTISTHETLENDMTDSWKIHSRGAVLYSLEAVMKLGMFMTGTPTAVKFRDLIIESLKEGVVFEENYNNVLDGYLNQMLLSAQKAELFDPAILGKVMESVSDTSLICYKNDILRTIDSLNNIYAEYMNLLQGINMITQRFQYTQVKSVIELLMISLNELQQVIIELDSVRLKANTSKELVTRSSLVKEAVLPKEDETKTDYSNRLKSLSYILELADYLKVIEDFTEPRRDANDKKIVLNPSRCNSKKNLFFDMNGVQHFGSLVLKYEKSNTHTEWIFNNEYVMNRDTKQQVLKFTPVGKSLWGALYRQANNAYEQIAESYVRNHGELNTEDLLNLLETRPQEFASICKEKINLTKDEFEAQYAYCVINDKTNDLILL